MYCGGDWRNSVYQLKADDPAPQPVTKKAKTGTNAGGWLVLEPWITPSLFYRFLDKTKE
jgi:glucan 1,3-beta-glucosidase